MRPASSPAPRTPLERSIEAKSNVDEGRLASARVRASMAFLRLPALLLALGLPASASAEEAGRRIGLETSVTFPIAEIYELHLELPVSQHGSAIVGPCFQHYLNDLVRAHAYTLIVGYRQYVWKGLHAEVSLFPAYNVARSLRDGRNYGGFELWAEAYVGYKFSIPTGPVTLTITPQPGIGFGIARQNPWPGFSSAFKPIFVPNLLVGAEF